MVLDVGEKKPTEVSGIYEDALRDECGEEVVKFVSAHLDMSNFHEVALLDTGSHINLLNVFSIQELISSSLKGVVNIKRLNDVRYVNKLLEEVNKKLAKDGVYILCVESSSMRKHRVLGKLRPPLNWMHYFIDFTYKRVFPKLKGVRKIYFGLSGGRNRVLSKIEVLGRLYSCGYELLEERQIDNLLWIAAAKKGDPDYNEDATYGPLIRLKRVGKGGKIIKVYKMRTMHPFSEYLQPYISEKYGLQKGGKFDNDPRITTVGRLFRKFWIDEMPMVINLIKRDIKVVGIRPISRHYLSLYPEDIQLRRRNYRPGLLPPFYADLPETLEEIVASEEKYMNAYDKRGVFTDVRYFFKIMYNIFIKRARSN